MTYRARRWLALICLVMIPVAARAQGAAEIVRGQITDPKQQPVAEATVTVTGTVSQQVRTTHTDKDGKFTVLFLEGDGSYSLIVRKIGYTPAIKRVSRTGLSNVVLADAVISTSAYPLDPLTVTATRTGAAAKLDRPSIGGLEQNALANLGFLLDPSDLDALIALTPGILATDSGYSVMGASQDQNSKLLDGMKFDGGSLPPDATCSVNVATSTSDPSRGGFAGGQTSVQTCRGRDYFLSSIRASLVDPTLTWSDAASPVNPSRLGNWSGFISGPFSAGVAHYRLSFSGNARATDAPSLLAPRAALLPQLGLSPDTISQLNSTLNGLHVPLTLGGIPSNAQNHNAAAFLSIDWNLGAATSILFTATGSLTGSDAAGLGQSSFPASLNQSTGRNGRLQLRASTYLHGFIDDITTVFSAASNTSSPYLALPTGSVRVGTEYADGQTSLTSLRFGGGSSGAHSATSEWNTRNQLSWLAHNNLHQLTFGQQLTLDWNTSLQSFNTLGTFSYQTLADLAANRPSSFTRTLDAAERSNHYSTAALWLADTWRASKAISFEGGLRFDAAHFSTSPAFNREIESLFGHRTDEVPNDIGFSPRLGFAWLLHARGPRTIKDPITGRNTTIMYLDLDMLNPTAPRGNTGAGITFYGDVGAFRGVIPPNRVAALVDRTGLPGTTRTLSCIGDATPIPDWSTSTGALFDTCVGGSTPIFSSNQPSVSLLDPAMRAPVDWKINLGLNGLYWGNWNATTSIALLREQNTESRLDLNLRNTVGFNLASEGNRPVYVTPGEIVPSTGFIAPGANRISNQYGAVMNSVSDLHRTAAQFNVTVTPPRFLNKLWFRFDYSYNTQRNEYRGFGGSTAGDPFAIESAAGAQPKHQLTVSLPNAARIWWFNTGIRAVVSSGTGYTPMISGDINGDGSSNDRAFVANPATTTDAALAAQMTTLLAAAPSTARACLSSQLGQIAATNSCRGPAQLRLDLTLDFSPPQGVGLGDRLHFTTRFLNAGAAIMRAAGVNSAVAQGSAPPDGRLLYVTGFDPVAQRFNYRVNQAFGQPLDFGLGSHRFPPFQLQVGMEYKLGLAPTNQNLKRLGLEPNKKSPHTADEVRKAMLTYTRSPVDTIVALRDSLELSAEQVTKLQAITAAYQVKADSAVAPVVTYVLDRGMKLTDNDMGTQTVRLLTGLSPLRTDARDRAMALLTEDQKVKFQLIQAASRRPVRLP